ncbi:MAG: hypothetical protein ACO4AY_08720 [Ilumatobacteraceae bacterium]
MTHRRWRVVAALLVTASLTGACAGEPAASPLRSYVLRLRADDTGDTYRYVAKDPVDIRVGDQVTFEFDNTGTLIHDLQIVAPDGTTIGAAASTRPGATSEVTVVFTEGGYFRLNCLVDDHLTVHRMQTVIEVTET